MSEHVKTEVADRIQSVCINRPDKKNALTLAMYTALSDAVRGADQDPNIRVTLIAGSGDAFCSGNDIKDFLNNPITDESSPVIQFVNTMIGAKKPVVAAVNGIAVGIGVTMLLHCDLVYVAEGARLQMPFVNIGLCPEAGSTFLLPVLMGHRRAAELLLLGGPFDAARAVELGIANAAVPAAQLQKTALEAARRIASQPPDAVRVTKGLLRAALQNAVKAASVREAEKFIPMLDGEEAKEALNAFMEKRKPDFSRF